MSYQATQNRIILGQSLNISEDQLASGSLEMIRNQTLKCFQQHLINIRKMQLQQQKIKEIIKNDTDYQAKIAKILEIFQSQNENNQQKSLIKSITEIRLAAQLEHTNMILKEKIQENIILRKQSKQKSQKIQGEEFLLLLEKQIIQRKDDDIKRLQQKYQQKVVQILQKEANVIQLKKEQCKLQEKNEELHKLNQSLNTENQYLHKQKASILSQLIQKKDALEHQSNERKSLQEKMLKLSQDLKKLQQKEYKDIQTDIRLRSAEEFIQTLQKQAIIFKENIKKLQKEKVQLQNLNKAQVILTENLKTQLQNISPQIIINQSVKQQESSEQLQAKMLELTENCQNLHKNIQELKQKNQDLSQKILVYESENKAQKVSISELQTQSKQLLNVNQELSQKLKKVQHQKIQFEEKNSALTVDIKNLRADFTIQKQNVAKLLEQKLEWKKSATQFIEKQAIASKKQMQWNEEKLLLDEQINLRNARIQELQRNAANQVVVPPRSDIQLLQMIRGFLRATNIKAMDRERLLRNIKNTIFPPVP